MRYWLVTENGNYADEFDLEAMKLVQAESKEDALEEVFEDHLEDDEWPKELYFGTNEAMEYENKEDLYDSVEIQEITYSEYSTIKRLLGTSFGTGAIL